MPTLSVQLTTEPDEEADPAVVLTYAAALAQRAGLPLPGEQARITVHRPFGIGPHRYEVAYGGSQPCPPT